MEARSVSRPERTIVGLIHGTLSRAFPRGSNSGLAAIVQTSILVATSMLSAPQVSALVETELAQIADSACREALRSRLVAPRMEQRDWDYGEPNESYPCWIVAVAPEYDVALAYCEHGFGPNDPWGAVFLGEPNIGMDAQWHDSLEAVFRQFIQHLDRTRRSG
jgi:hypothetical protein